MSDMNEQRQAFNVWDFVIFIKRKGLVILGSALLVAFITGVVSLFMPNIYKSDVVIVPVQSKRGDSAGGLSSLLSASGGAASAVVGALYGGGTGDITRLGVFLNSRTLSEKVVENLNLLPVLYPTMWDAKNGKWKNDDPKYQPDIHMAAGTLFSSHMKVSTNKRDGVITISCLFGDPEMAKKIADGYIEALQWFINNKALTAAKRNRIFIGEQLRENEMALLSAGKEMKDLYKEGRVSSIDAATDISLDDLTSKEVELRSAIGSLQDQMRGLDQKIESSKIIRDVPQQVYLSYVSMKNALLVRINAMLASQYAMAKIEENKEDLAFEVVDQPLVAKGRSSPRPKFMCTGAFVISIVIISFLTFYIDTGRLHISSHARIATMQPSTASLEPVEA